ncbi:hypothetical protein SY2F82_75890 [Streptomyces sp. Y2F8-2]|nr:hypothetical protein SY2F82_75890 [Streptomyces sp. Y2F8-2]
MEQDAVSQCNRVVKNADENQPTATDKYSEVAAPMPAQDRDEPRFIADRISPCRHKRVVPMKQRMNTRRINFAHGAESWRSRFGPCRQSAAIRPGSVTPLPSL